MYDAEQIAKLRLIRSENVGCVTYAALVGRFGSARNALENLPETAKRGGARFCPHIYTNAQAQKEIEALEKFGASLIFDTDEAYPPLLKQIPDAPPVLSVVGDTGLLRTRFIALVGTRNASINGRHMARQMAADFVQAGFSVVSGLALGIDAAAHEGALTKATAKASTVAVLGTGVNVPYPNQNRELYARTREKGAIVSEFPFDTKPAPSNFPRRNRIISGMAESLTVIEASLRSGSLITARKALEQGRDVYAVPANPLDARASGVNRLIKDGAPLVESAADVLENMAAFVPSMLKEEAAPMLEPAPAQNFSEADLTAARPELLEKLDFAPVGVDELIRETGLPARAISALLAELELAGKIERLPGNKILRLSDG